MINLTNEILASYIGGKVTVDYGERISFFEGEIKNAVIEGRNLQIHLNNMDRNKQYPKFFTHWIDDTLIFEVSFENYALSEKDDKDKIYLKSIWFGDIILSK